MKAEQRRAWREATGNKWTICARCRHAKHWHGADYRLRREDWHCYCCQDGTYRAQESAKSVKGEKDE